MDKKKDKIKSEAVKSRSPYSHVIWKNIQTCLIF